MERVEKAIGNCSQWLGRFYRNYSKILCLLLLASLSIFPSTYSLEAAPGNGIRPEYWQIEYTSSFAGKMTVKFYSEAIYMKMEKLGLTVISTAPAWNSLVYNDVNKCFMRVSNEQWKSSKFIENLLQRRKSLVGEVRTEFTRNVKSIVGLDATQVLVKSLSTQGVYEPYSEIWVSKALSVPSQFKHFLRVALGVSDAFDGTPLQIWVAQKIPGEKTPQMVQKLAAYKLTKMPEDETTFAKLKGYKEVKSEVTLLVQEESNQ